MSPHDQIRTVLATYCQCCDDGEFETFAQLFTEDASFVVMGTTQRGRDAIRSFMEAAQPPERRGKHLISEPVIELGTDGSTASCRTDYAFVARDAGGRGLSITSSGRYLDRLHREADDRWRIARREIVFLGDEPEAQPT